MLVNKMNASIVVGLPLATGCYFMSNRLLLPEMESREDYERIVFLIVWLFSLIHAWIRKGVSIWVEQLLFTGLVFICLPIIDFLLTGTQLKLAIFNLDFVYLGFNIFSAFFGSMLFLAGIKLYRYK